MVWRTPRRGGDHPAQRATVATLARRYIHPRDLDWTWRAPSSSIERFAPVLLDAADIVTATGRQRLRHCDGCDWLFEDQSRNGKRRWCDMADCGSRAKSRDYYHRRKP